MADELLWGVKNGDLDAVKKSCEKVILNEIDLKCHTVCSLDLMSMLNYLMAVILFIMLLIMDKLMSLITF